MTKGRCYTIQFEKANSALVMAVLTVKAPRQLQMYVHEPGEEPYFSGAVSSWPAPILFGSQGQLDIRLQKKIYIKQKNCIKDQNYDYFGMNATLIYKIS